MPKFKTYNQNQLMLLPLDLKECLPKDHICFMINEVVDNLDLTDIEKTYADFGSPAYHPKMFIKLLFYCYTQGIRSSRKIEKSAYENNACRFLAANQTFDHGTISLFRKNHLQEIETLFAQIVVLCNGLGIIDLSNLSIDGSIVKANASKKKTLDQKELKKIKQRIRGILQDAQEIDAKEDELYGNKRGYNQMPERLVDPETRKKEIERLKKKLDQINQAEKVIQDKQIKAKTKEESRKTNNQSQNLTDPEAKLMKMKGGKIYRPAYNTQIATNNQVILGYEVFDKETDINLLDKVIEKTEKLTGCTVNKIKADAGYFSKDNIRYTNQKKIDAYIPDPQKKVDERRQKSRFDKENFRYDPQTRRYVCPLGQELRHKDNRKGALRYIGTNCGNCQSRSKCTKGKYRQIQVDEELERYRQKMRQKLNSKTGKEVYLERMHDVEPVFGNLKENQGLNHFLLRGKTKVNIEFGLSCIAHNLVKIANWIKKEKKEVQLGTLMKLPATG